MLQFFYKNYFVLGTSISIKLGGKSGKVHMLRNRKVILRLKVIGRGQKFLEANVKFLWCVLIMAHNF